MKNFVVAIVLLVASVGPAGAQYGQEWQSAMLTSSEPLQGAFGYYRCFYRTLGGYTFTVNNKGMCSNRVMVNIETGQVR